MYALCQVRAPRQVRGATRRNRGDSPRVISMHYMSEKIDFLVYASGDDAIVHGRRQGCLTGKLAAGEVDSFVSVSSFKA